MTLNLKFRLKVQSQNFQFKIEIIYYVVFLRLSTKLLKTVIKRLYILVKARTKEDAWEGSGTVWNRPVSVWTKLTITPWKNHQRFYSDTNLVRSLNPMKGSWSSTQGQSFTWNACGWGDLVIQNGRSVMIIGTLIQLIYISSYFSEI